MKTENFFKETIENYSNDDLNTLLINFDMYVYTDNDFNRWLQLDDDTHILLNTKCSLFYYFKVCLENYKITLKETAKNELKRQINNLLNIK